MFACDEGHKILTLIAEHNLDPAVSAKIATLLAADTNTLIDHDIASAATSADKHRDSNSKTTKICYQAPRQWHLVDIELGDPNLDLACFGRPLLPPGVPATAGPARACVVDKIDQFAAELRNQAIGAPDRLLALKFLLHLVGDLHQPLDVTDDHDAGGSRTLVAAEGLRADNLHHYWDIEFIERLGTELCAKLRPV